MQSSKQAQYTIDHSVLPITISMPHYVVQNYKKYRDIFKINENRHSTKQLKQEVNRNINLQLRSLDLRQRLQLFEQQQNQNRGSFMYWAQCCQFQFGSSRSSVQRQGIYNLRIQVDKINNGVRLVHDEIVSQQNKALINEIYLIIKNSLQSGFKECSGKQYFLVEYEYIRWWREYCQNYKHFIYQSSSVQFDHDQDDLVYKYNQEYNRNLKNSNRYLFYSHINLVKNNRDRSFKLMNQSIMSISQTQTSQFPCLKEGISFGKQFTLLPEQLYTILKPDFGYEIKRKINAIMKPEGQKIGQFMNLVTQSIQQIKIPFIYLKQGQASQFNIIITSPLLSIGQLCLKIVAKNGNLATKRAVQMIYYYTQYTKQQKMQLLLAEQQFYDYQIKIKEKRSKTIQQILMEIQNFFNTHVKSKNSRNNMGEKLKKIGYFIIKDYSKQNIQNFQIQNYHKMFWAQFVSVMQQNKYANHRNIQQCQDAINYNNNNSFQRQQWQMMQTNNFEQGRQRMGNYSGDNQMRQINSNNMINFTTSHLYSVANNPANRYNS